MIPRLFGGFSSGCSFPFRLHNNVLIPETILLLPRRVESETVTYRVTDVKSGTVSNLLKLQQGPEHLIQRIFSDWWAPFPLLPLARPLCGVIPNKRLTDEKKEAELPFLVLSKVFEQVT